MPGNIIQRLLAAVGSLVLGVTFTPVVELTAVALEGSWNVTPANVLIVLAGSMVEHEHVVLAGESSYWRCVHAAYLFRQKYFHYILISGKNGEALKPLLITFGVPDEAILIEPASVTTRENALYSKSVLKNLAGPYALLTSDYHMYRARRCFERVGVPVTPNPAPDMVKRSGDLAYRWQGFWQLTNEFVKIGYYKIRGWN